VRERFDLALLGLWSDWWEIAIFQMIFRLLVIGIQRNFYLPPQKLMGGRKGEKPQTLSFLCLLTSQKHLPFIQTHPLKVYLASLNPSPSATP
jgi:hypothetical protein